MQDKLLAGEYYHLPIDRLTAPGAYLKLADQDVLLPNRYVPKDAKVGDEVNVFVYHDSEGRLISTTDKPNAIVGELAFMKAVMVTDGGAFLDWGLAKDLLLPKSQQRDPVKVGKSYLVYVYRDEESGRVAATEWYDDYVKGDITKLQEKQEVEILVVRQTPLGYAVIFNNAYEGLIHHADAVMGLRPGQQLPGFIKQIRPDGKIDLVPGKPGYQKVEGEAGRILEMLKAGGGMLPYTDKSHPDEIYSYFGISKKAFKMAVGALYKQRLIELLPGGIKLL